jgi:hypothetical protein
MMKTKRNPNLFQSKKGIEVWISWILLTAMVVILGVFMYQFMVAYTEDNTDMMEETLTDHRICQRTALAIDTICKVDSDPDQLELTLSNTGSESIDGVKIRLFDNATNFLNDSEIIFYTDNLTFRAQQRKSVVYNLTESLYEDVSLVALVPILFVETETGRTRVICSNRRVESNRVALC